jgi:hypothetical protein
VYNPSLPPGGSLYLKRETKLLNEYVTRDTQLDEPCVKRWDLYTILFAHSCIHGRPFKNIFSMTYPPERLCHVSIVLFVIIIIIIIIIIKIELPHI